ncbi:MAG: flagellar export protein FliJ [Lentisphaeria bacterium]|nr:flagellar export protein FliJ [Lentisphaeria bacterium]NQZ66575.1 flagellar export protein FliJ [Lentisphaeria bacterium]
MKRFIFSLQSILSIKESQKSICEIHLHETRVKMQAAINTLDSVKESLYKSQMRLNQSISINYLVQREKYTNKLNAQVKSIGNTIGMIQEELEIKLNNLKEIAREIKKLEKHREKEYSLWTEEADREEQKTLDEISLRSTGFSVILN